MAKKLILYIAASLDGYIARTNGDLDWLDVMQMEGEDYGYNAFVSTIDTVIIGRKTYEKVLEMGFEYPHKDKISYVITRKVKPQEENIHFYSGDLVDLVLQLKQEEGGNIYCDGGAEIVNALMSKHLIDEYIISIIPVFLGEGIRLFKGNLSEQKLQLLSCKSFPSGLVQVHYKK